MDMNRREFLKRGAWGSAALAAAGCVGPAGFGFGRRDTMCGFAAPPMDRIRIGIIGTGGRGTTCGQRFVMFEGVEVTALCDIRPEGPDALCDFLKKGGYAAPKRYTGSVESYKALCDDPNVDVVYVTTPAQFHATQVLYAMRAGKHAFTEVPGGQGTDQLWELVETCEETRRHCMMLENCLYGEEELLAFTICHKGLLGTLTHAEAGYIHNLTWRNLADSYRNRLRHYDISLRRGNGYPTHGLGPVCAYMDVNRGDKMDFIVSVSSKQATWREYAKEVYPPDAWQNKGRIEMGDMNTSIIKTAMGRTIMMQYDLSTPRPYTRLNLIQGTKGCFASFPYRVGFTDIPGEHCDFFDAKKAAEVRDKYRHPLWTKLGNLARSDGGHGGLDFLMDLRWIYCLKNGLPLDMDVYDMASWSVIIDTSALSDLNGGRPIDIPDFTRGAWRTTKPLTIEHFDVDVAKTGLKALRKKA